LAVVVQKMIPSETSGILFTANPVTGLRSEVVIDATIGLGELLVGGHVEPDHYVVNPSQRKILSKSLGSKEFAMHSTSGGGLLTEEIDARDKQALPDESILGLVDLGMKVTDLFNFPQDIEWAYSGSELFILQSRPITSLFPLPDGMDSNPLRVMFAFGAVQGIMEPFTPLGQDTIRLIFAGGASLFGFAVTHETQGVIKIAGERLWGDMTGIIHHPIGSRVAMRVLSAVEPTVQQILITLGDEPELERGKGQLRLSILGRLLRFAGPFLRRVLRYIRSPYGVAEQIHDASQAEINRLDEKRKTWKHPVPTLEESLDLYHEIYNAFPFAIPEIVSAIAAGLIPFFLLNKIATDLTGSDDLGLEITRGLKHNVTTEMDLGLWEIARKIRADQIAYQHMLNSDTRTLASEYLNQKLPETAQYELSRFLKIYGMRGLGEIDIGRPRWNEDPRYIFEVLLNYLQLEDKNLAPDVVFRKGEQAAEKALADLQKVARGTFAGKIKAAAVQKLAIRVWELAGLRESPKFHIIQMMGIIRQALLDSGRELVTTGVLVQPDDLFYLHLMELEELARSVERDWRGLVAKRRAAYNRELTRKKIPRLLLSDGRTFYEGMIASQPGDTELIGSPVSPGYVEGSVRIVLDPLNANLSPGEIMVCPGTDPAWTPLFMTAGGLIMEVGGMMTHGAIVAREYGIPAVVGVHKATTTLKTGQYIKLNGSTGEIIIEPG
jgi:phosphohistidine swiveling domain-containing protein